MRGGKHYFAVVKRDGSRQGTPKKSHLKKTTRRKRKTAKRQSNFKSSSWYEKAALSMGISANREGAEYARPDDFIYI